MTRTHGSTSTFARSSRRPLLPVALTALAVLALGACGTAKATEGGGEPAAQATASAPPAPAATMGSLSSPALAEIQAHIAQSCPAAGTRQEGPPSPQPAPPGEEAQGPGIVPIAPTAGPMVELDTRDWCAGVSHEQQVYLAVEKIAKPTPVKVRAALNAAGYPDERIHDLKQAGATTHFSLDLRENGGRLCVRGAVGGGEEAVVDKCVAPATGPFAAGGTQY
ncbi:hypothetical protein [Streptomyces sp. NBC_01264]|uniref:hypothetical protein n=1 Tax=Streptomyces sp. NBC_01264 TaxID=2903804 RepID=UPI002256F97D|nr:hypothetical protein [Streptomyces sp. NBC_01264]MCX4777970.1 hypothetical protein [Streptomyces sp. NBC_01264]